MSLSKAVLSVIVIDFECSSLQEIANTNKKIEIKYFSFSILGYRIHTNTLGKFQPAGHFQDTQEIQMNSSSVPYYF